MDESKQRNKLTQKPRYSGFLQIDGRHPLQERAPQACVNYPVRTRHGGKVFYFNFPLARQMGLISSTHPDKLNPALEQAILQAFAIQIINEYDQLHKTPIAKKDIREHPCMATRYLQMQHPNKQGKTSGDGRSVWNGLFRGKGHWDISSCGTGATRLSPACAREQRFFQTGEKTISYGCGRADLIEGVNAALMSEIYHRSGISTERTLAVIEFRDGTAINVRAAPNLLRPAHLFAPLKQGRHDVLKALLDLHIEREQANRNFPRGTYKKAYDDFLQRICHDFARAAAIFETEYMFVWMDWDGDNILMDAGIIDYGSIRQFGLFHKEYRYDDVDTYSTNIIEQKNRARYTVQVFAQLVDFVKTGHKKNIKQFRHHPILKEFDRQFLHHKLDRRLFQLGFDEEQRQYLLQQSRLHKTIIQLDKKLRYFEKAKSSAGAYTVTDGITQDAIFCIRDVLRELPAFYLEHDNAWMSHEYFIELMRSDYAQDKDVAPYLKNRQHSRQLQKAYYQLVSQLAEHSQQDVEQILIDMDYRAQLINRYDRLTGDGLIGAAEQLMRSRHRMDSNERFMLMNAFIESEVLNPEHFNKDNYPKIRLTKAPTRKILKSMIKAVQDSREGI